MVEWISAPELMLSMNKFDAVVFKFMYAYDASYRLAVTLYFFQYKLKLLWVKPARILIADRIWPICVVSSARSTQKSSGKSEVKHKKM